MCTVKYVSLVQKVQKYVSFILNLTQFQVCYQIIESKIIPQVQFKDFQSCHLLVLSAHHPQRIEVLVAGAEARWVEVHSQVVLMPTQLDLEASLPSYGGP